ncbi:MAG: hypothetical protein IJ055_02555 [Oscillospiraceae bacterium]|nr:hypothetical protein [Oscillospiraceae bacterium]
MMSTRDYAVSVLAALSEEKMLEFIKLFADENTLARMESDRIAEDRNAPRFQSVDALFEELDSE